MQEVLNSPQHVCRANVSVDLSRANAVANRINVKFGKAYNPRVFAIGIQWGQGLHAFPDYTYLPEDVVNRHDSEATLAQTPYDLYAGKDCITIGSLHYIVRWLK